MNKKIVFSFALVAAVLASLISVHFYMKKRSQEGKPAITTQVHSLHKKVSFPKKKKQPQKK